ncbi:MAG TPA: hypothetical protein VGJ42_03410 [Nitrososphaera sp.]
MSERLNREQILKVFNAEGIQRAQTEKAIKLVLKLSKQVRENVGSSPSEQDNHENYSQDNLQKLV